MYTIYCYTNLINNKKYIGQTKNAYDRFMAHKSAVTNINSGEYESPLHRAMRKYGYENFKYEVLNEVENVDLANGLEIFYIQYYKSQIPSGYNILEGGRNANRVFSEETKEKMRWSHGKLTKEEVIFLRLAYANNESPSKIYNELYKDRLHYNSFLNIWTGKRYATVMPEIIQNGRHTKLTEEQVKEIKLEY